MTVNSIIRPYLTNSTQIYLTKRKKRRVSVWDGDVL